MSPNDAALRASIVNSSLQHAQHRHTHRCRRGSLVDGAAVAVGALLSCIGVTQLRRAGCAPLTLGLAVLYAGLTGLESGVPYDHGEPGDIADDIDPRVASNPVDEAVWESFPASDPPSFSGQIT